MRDLNLDVLELIFAHLSSGNDLASVALVSRSFFAGVVARLYANILFRISQSKRYSTVIAPFAAILKHRELAVHVRSIDIQAVPIIKDSLAQQHPKFLKDSADVLKICHNLSSFTCICPIVPQYLSSLQKKPRLQEIRLHANLITDQAEKLIQLEGLYSITLDYASWNMVDLLPKWILTNKKTLKLLTLYSTGDLNETILDRCLVQLPKLLGLHIINCQNIDFSAVLRCIIHTPLLESLSLTTFVKHESLQLPTPHPPLRNLIHLALDCRSAFSGAPTANNTNSLFSRLFSDILLPSSPPLRTIYIRLADSSLVIPDPWLNDVLRAYGGTLRKVSLGNCSVSVEAVRKTCEKCLSLEGLEVCIPVKDIRPFTLAMAKSSTLSAVVDLSDQHATHTPKVALARDSIKYMMTTVPSLRTVECDGRIWTRKNPINGGNTVRISLERRKNTSSDHWFLQN